MVAIWASVRVVPAWGGGMRVALLGALTRAKRRLLAGSPGVMMLYVPRLAKSPSPVSSRRLATRRLSSGPWHVKQLSERMGRTSRSKSTGLSAAKHTPAKTSHRDRRTDKVPSGVSSYFELFGENLLALREVLESGHFGV